MKKIENLVLKYEGDDKKTHNGDRRRNLYENNRLFFLLEITGLWISLNESLNAGIEQLGVYEERLSGKGFI